MSNLQQQHDDLRAQYEAQRSQRDLLNEMERMKREMASLAQEIEDKKARFPGLVLEDVSKIIAPVKPE